MYFPSKEKDVLPIECENFWEESRGVSLPKIPYTFGKNPSRMLFTMSEKSEMK